MRKYLVTLTGTQPLLMHHDNVEWSDLVKRWQQDPDNKKYSVAGDDRSPAWSWMGKLYHDEDVIGIPSDNLMTMLREGGTLVPVPGGKGGKTFKAQTQSGILTEEILWPITIGGATPQLAPILDLRFEADFEKHQAVVKAQGFELFTKRAKPDGARGKHIRVRPMFREWETSGVLLIFDDQITENVLGQILDTGGRFKGMGDWRPSSPKKPGPFGTFKATFEEAS